MFGPSKVATLFSFPLVRKGNEVNVTPVGLTPTELRVSLLFALSLSVCLRLVGGKQKKYSFPPFCPPRKANHISRHVRMPLSRRISNRAHTNA